MKPYSNDTELLLDKAARACVRVWISGHVLYETKISDKYISEMLDPSAKELVSGLEFKTNKPQNVILNKLCKTHDRNLNELWNMQTSSKLIFNLNKRELKRVSKYYLRLALYSYAIYLLLDEQNKLKLGFYNIGLRWIEGGVRCNLLTRANLTSQKKKELEYEGRELRNKVSQQLYEIIEASTIGLYLPTEKHVYYNKNSSKTKSTASETESFLVEQAYTLAIESHVKELKEGNPPSLEAAGNKRLIAHALKMDLLNEIEKSTRRYDHFIGSDNIDDTSAFKTDLGTNISATVDSIEDTILAHDIYEFIETSESLNNIEREVFKLRYEEHTFEYIGERLGISKQMAHKNYESAKNKIEDQITPSEAR